MELVIMNGSRDIKSRGHYNTEMFIWKPMPYADIKLRLRNSGEKGPWKQKHKRI
jgi:hypothetical protein